MSEEQKPEVNTKPDRIKCRQALIDYLSLGPDRSIEKLHRQYIENAPKPPCLRSLKGWSARYGWQEKAAQHDEQIASQVTKKAEGAAVKRGLDHVKALTDVADKALRKVIQGLDTDSIKADSAYELAALVNSALGAIKGVQLLTGQPTERFGAYTVKDSAPEWMQERLKAPATAASASDEANALENVTRH